MRIATGAVVLGLLAGAAAAHPSASSPPVRIGESSQPYAKGDLQTLGGAHGVLFAGFDGALFRSDDGGVNWAASHLPASSAELALPLRVAACNGALWLAFTQTDLADKSGSGGVYSSADLGRNWTLRPITDGRVHGVIARADTLIAYGTGCWFLAPGATGFQAWSQGLDSGEVASPASDGSNLYVTLHSASASRYSVYKSAGPGLAWEPGGGGLPENTDWSLAMDGGVAYALAAGRGIYLTDGHSDWARLPRPFGDFGDLAGAAFFRAGNSLGLLTPDSAFRRDPVSGDWQSLGCHGAQLRLTGVTTDSDRIFGLAGGTLMQSRDTGVTWSPFQGGSGFRESGRNPLLNVIDWGGRRFLHYSARTYWTIDGGKSWKSHSWWSPAVTGKDPRNTLPDARFKSPGRDLFLDGGASQRFFARFDPGKDDWAPIGLDGSPGNPVTAMGCDSNRIYLFSAQRGLSLSENRGVSWMPIPFPGDTARYGSSFGRVQAEGGRILLGFDRPGAPVGDMGSTDGGKTWKSFPRGQDMYLFEGCFHWAEGGVLHSDCGPGGQSGVAAAPFTRIERLFRQESGELYAYTDSGCYRFSAAPSPAWETAGDPGQWRDWSYHGELLSLQTDTLASWIAPGVPIPMAVRSRNAPGPRHGIHGPHRLSGWLKNGRRPDGRALIRGLPD